MATIKGTNPDVLPNVQSGGLNFQARPAHFGANLGQAPGQVERAQAAGHSASAAAHSQTAQAFKGMEKAFVDMAIRRQDIEDKTRLMELNEALTNDDASHSQKGGLYTLTGYDTKGMRDKGKTHFKDLKNSLKGLTDHDRTRMQARQMVFQYETKFDHNINRVATAGEEWIAKDLLRRQKIAQFNQLSSAIPDPETGLINLDFVSNVSQTAYALQEELAGEVGDGAYGKHGDVIVADGVNSHLSSGFVNVIAGSLNRGDIGVAKLTLAQYKGGMKEKDVKKAEEIIEKAETDATAADVVSWAFENRPYETEKAYADIDARRDLTDDEKDASKKLLRVKIGESVNRNLEATKWYSNNTLDRVASGVPLTVEERAHLKPEQLSAYSTIVGMDVRNFAQVMDTGLNNHLHEMTGRERAHLGFDYLIERAHLMDIEGFKIWSKRFSDAMVEFDQIGIMNGTEFMEPRNLYEANLGNHLFTEFESFADWNHPQAEALLWDAVGEPGFNATMIPALKKEVGRFVTKDTWESATDPIANFKFYDEDKSPGYEEIKDELSLLEHKEPGKFGKGENEHQYRVLSRLDREYISYLNTHRSEHSPAVFEKWWAGKLLELGKYSGDNYYNVSQIPFTDKQSFRPMTEWAPDRIEAVNGWAGAHGVFINEDDAAILLSLEAATTGPRPYDEKFAMEYDLDIVSKWAYLRGMESVRRKDGQPGKFEFDIDDLREIGSQSKNSLQMLIPVFYNDPESIPEATKMFLEKTFMLPMEIFIPETYNRYGEAAAMLSYPEMSLWGRAVDWMGRAAFGDVYKEGEDLGIKTTKVNRKGAQ